VLAEQFRLPEVPELAPRYNIAPTQPVAAVRQAADERELRMVRWGLVPGWASDPALGARMINARAETVSEKPAFRSAFKRRRCLVLADGFYEWQATSTRQKQPHYFALHDRRPFAFAGLWEYWEGAEGAFESCTIITTDANDLVRPTHNRMPVILQPADYDLWLDPAMQQAGPLEALLRPAAASAMMAYPVSRAVNNPRNDSPECVAAIA
jgi:putative SOS response-associated peptidase YedK